MQAPVVDESKNLVLDLVKQYLVTRDGRLDLERAVKTIKQKEDELEQHLWTVMESMGFSSIKTEVYGTISRTFNRLFNIEDMQIFREWCDKTHNHDLLREEVHKRNLRNFCQERIKEGLEDAIPPGIEMQVNNIIHVRGRNRGNEDAAEEV